MTLCKTAFLFQTFRNPIIISIHKKTDKTDKDDKS